MARRKKTVDEMIQQGLSDLAFGKVSDAVSLLFLSDEEILAKLPKLNLLNVSEIKRPKAGGMEIKFFDRLKAIDMLHQRTEGKNDSSLSFFEALEKSARDNSGDFYD